MLQTILTIGTSVLSFLFIVAVSLPFIGRAMRDRGRKMLAADPTSARGLYLVGRGGQLVEIGADMKAFGRSPIGVAVLPDRMRHVLESIPDMELEVPAGQTVQITAPRGAPAKVTATSLVPPAVLFALCLGSTGCMEAQRQVTQQLDNAGDAIRAAGELATFAEPRLRALYEVEIRECLKNPDTDDAAACIATVRQVYAPARASMETIRTVRCLAKPEPSCDEPAPAWGEPTAATP